MQKPRLDSQRGQFHTRGPIIARGGPGTSISTVATLHFNVIGRVCIGFLAGRVPLSTTVRRLSQASNEWELQANMPPIEDLGLPENESTVPISVQVHFRDEFLDTLYCGDFHYTRQGTVRRLQSGSLMLTLGFVDRSGSQSDADPVEPQFAPSDVDAKPGPPRVNRTASVSSSHGRRRGKKAHIQVATRRASYTLLRVPRSPTHQEPEGSPLSLQFASALQTLCESWTEEELEIGRRLAKFTTVREGNNFVLSCAPIRQEAYDPEDVVISCIYYKGTDEHYVTSVDILYLFENVADEALGTSEKTRLRRNIQSFLPTRVEKADREYGELYTQIMKFPPPKPRTIEKKIKVFRWVLLEDILSKIASKYVSFDVPI